MARNAVLNESPSPAPKANAQGSNTREKVHKQSAENPIGSPTELNHVEYSANTKKESAQVLPPISTILPNTSLKQLLQLQ